MYALKELPVTRPGHASPSGRRACAPCAGWAAHCAEIWTAPASHFQSPCHKTEAVANEVSSRQTLRGLQANITLKRGDCATVVKKRANTTIAAAVRHMAHLNIRVFSRNDGSG